MYSTHELVMWQIRSSWFPTAPLCELDQHLRHGEQIHVWIEEQKLDEHSASLLVNPPEQQWTKKTASIVRMGQT